MSKYFGVTCPVCAKEFTDDDDIVVCPDCGTPHHRVCYKKLDGCAMVSRHAEPGFAWEAPASLRQSPPEPTTPVRAQGGTGAPDYTRNFSPDAEAHREKPQFPAFPQPAGEENSPFQVQLDEEMDGVSVRDVAQFVGPNAYYYLLRFKLMLSGAHTFSPNFAAMFFSFFYYFNRKMYKYGAVLLALFLLRLFPSLLWLYYVYPDLLNSLPMLLSGIATPSLSGHEGLLMFDNLMRYVYFGACLASGLVANKLYCGFVFDRIKAIRTRYKGDTEQVYAQSLSIGGRTNMPAVIAVFGALLLGFFAYCVLVSSVYGNLL